MPYLTGGVFIAIALTLVNLVLTFGVIRRLREHTELLSARHTAAPAIMLGVGESPDGFTATTVDDEQITLQTLGGEQLVGFFSPSCEPCKEKAPLFAERAALGGRSRALAVVVGRPGEATELVKVLQPAARVVVESDLDGGSLGRAFKVKGFPAICTLDRDGVVTASGSDVLHGAASRKPPSLVS